jgi:hypothetical protein
LARNTVTPMHLLHPTNLTIQLDKCLITDDPRLPKLKVIGHLPNVAINITGNFPLVIFCVEINICKDVICMHCVGGVVVVFCLVENTILYKVKLCRADIFK